MLRAEPWKERLMCLLLIAALPGSAALPSGGKAGASSEIAAFLKAKDYDSAAAAARLAIARAEKEHGMDSLETARCLDTLIEVFNKAKKTEAPDAKASAQRAVRLKEKHLGKDHAEVALSLRNYASLLTHSGDYDAARPLFERALAIQGQAVSDEAGAETGRTLHEFAYLVETTGDYAGAKALYERALAATEKALGLNHPEVALRLSNLGYVHRRLGQYKEALPFFERALAIQEDAFGPEDPDLAATLNKMAVVLADLGEFDQARQAYERSLAVLEKALGPEHGQLASVLNNLAILFWRLGDYQSAKTCYERALAIREKTLGPEHPNTAAAVNNLAILLQQTGEYAKARALYERALAINEKTLGKDHQNMSRPLNNLAGLLCVLGDYDGAKALFERALAIDERSKGPEHAELAFPLQNLSILLECNGEYAAARPYTERALAIRRKALGPAHPDVAESVSALGRLLYLMGDYAHAKEQFKLALEIKRKALGADHEATATAQLDYADLLMATGKHDEARPLFERALAVKEKALGPGHADVASARQRLATLYLESGELAAARPLLEQALAEREKALGSQHLDVAESLQSLAALSLASGDPARACKLFERGLGICETGLGPDHPQVGHALTGLARALMAAGRPQEALEAALRAEAAGRSHLQLTMRVLPEREALRFASVRASGLDTALSLAALNLIDEDKAGYEILDALIRSRALVLDEVAARHATAGDAANPALSSLASQLTAKRRILANLIVRGPEDQPPEIYRKLIDHATKEKEMAERAFAEKSVAFRRAQASSRLGLENVSAAIPESGALVAYVRFNLCGAPPCQASQPSGRKLTVAKASSDPVAGRAGGARQLTEPSYLAFVMLKGAATPRVVRLGAGGPIEALVERWQQEASKGATAPEGSNEALPAYRDAGEQLRRLIWDPISVLVQDVDRVFVVPDGALHLVNLAALPVGDVHYLVERGPLLHYLSAERDLVRDRSDTRVGKGLLAFGNPDFETPSLFAALAATPRKEAEREGWTSRIASLLSFRGQRSGCGDFETLVFEALPASGYEARQIAKLWSNQGGDDRQVVYFASGPDANESAFKADAPGRRVLHLATHGFFMGGHCESGAGAGTRGIKTLGPRAQPLPPPVLGENPLLLSGLALAGANHRTSAGPGEDDGVLTAEEIASLNLSGVEWAVLSACETGVGEIKTGEGVLGLRRAFETAGVETLIMTLWSVEDQATREWMRALYEARFSGRRDTAQSVREATLRTLERRRAEGVSTHPFFWGSFVAAGNWQ